MPKYYSTKEIILRGIWNVVEPILFSRSPRLFYAWRNFILRIMGAQIGRGVKIYPSAQIMYPWLLKIGDHTTISWNVRIYNLSYSTIGNETMISQHSHLCGGTHDFRSKDFTLIRTGFTIGNRVWIAADAFIGPNVIVADGAVVGARSVVMKNVPIGCIVAGNPARVIGNV